jgi:hypothetical protein
MSKYRILNTLMGIQHIDQTIGSVPDTTQRLPSMGAILGAVDPYWGGGEFMYVRFGGTVREKGLCVVTPTYDATSKSWFFTAVEVGNTANLGQMVGVAVLPAAVGQFGWLQISGMTPVNCAAAVAADTSFGIGAAGQGGAVAAGKQILSARIAGASTITSVKVATAPGVVGGFSFSVANTDGWFVGGYVSGTGVGAAAKVTAIDTAEQIVTVSVANTAAVTGNVTFTYNNGAIYYNVAHLQRPFAQGAIT